ncbi:hypothetical protein ACQ4PT_021051 [Festuca glaucescens]
MAGSLILKHRGGSISSLKVPWRVHDYPEDVPVPGLLFCHPDRPNNLLAMEKGQELWNSSLASKDIVSRFETVELPLPSTFADDVNSHFMKLFMYGNRGYGWYTIYKKEDDADKYVANGSVKFEIEPLITGNLKHSRPYSIHDFEFFRGTIGSEAAASLIPSCSHFDVDTEMLGKGTQGEVFKGYDILTKKIIVMKKLIHPMLLDNGEPREVFFSKNVNHESIRDFQSSLVDENGVRWIVLDHVKRTLNDYIDENNEFNMIERLSIFIQICEAGEHLINEGIIYIDLEPGNVLLTEDSDTWLADLGSSVLMEGSTCKPLDFQSWLPQYAAPEILSKKIHNEKVVSFSTGLMYFVLASKYFPQRQREERMKKFRFLISSPKFAADPKKTWRASKQLYQGFLGDDGFLLDMVNPNFANRLGMNAILKKARELKKAMELKKARELGRP